MNEKILQVLNDQVQAEFVAFYTYLSMSAWLEANDWPGFAQWMRTHSDEEQIHAMKIYDFIFERKGAVTLKAIEQPPTEFASVEAAFEAALAHEQKVTAMINNIYKLAQTEGDYHTEVLMQWFINEQVEEEKIVEDALVLIRRAGNDPFQLLYVEKMVLESQQAAAAAEAGADAGA